MTQKKICLIAILLASHLAWPLVLAAAEPLSVVFKRVSGSVVMIRTTQKQFAEGRERQLVNMGGLGSGILISAEGKVMTAAHLVQTADDIMVEFQNGDLVKARVVSSEPTADVALLQLEKAPPKGVVAKLGDSEKVEVGDEVFVVGAPLGMGHTLTVGHISARRNPNTVYGGMSRSEFFQTDATINQGNSGGPMFNMAGEVIGIVSHILSKSGGSEGLGFVVTSDMARRILLERNPFWSGIEGYLLSGEMAKVFNLPQPAGLLIQRVAANSPAAQVGLRAGTMRAVVEGESLILGGDIILEVQGFSILEGATSYKAIREEVGKLPKGAAVKMTVLRDGRKQELLMKVP